MEPLPPDHGHNPTVLRSWAKRTGYKSYVSGESVIHASDVETSSVNPNFHPSTAKGPHLRNSTFSQTKPGPRSDNLNGRSSEFVAIPPPPPPLPQISSVQHLPPSSDAQSVMDRKPNANVPYVHLQGSQAPNHDSFAGHKDSEVEMQSQMPSEDADDVLLAKQSRMKLEIRENPSIVKSTVYGLQQYLSMIGSIVLIPLLIVPAMGGSDEDTANVLSTVFMVTGLATVMHTFFGSRLPLVQGSSFVYLAPALAVINSTEFQRISSDRFKITMRELQGAVIVASIFKTFLGYSGLISILLRFINPVVVTSTMTAVGLAFYSYGFPVVGSCIEIGLPQIITILIFSLYLRRVSVFGHRIFQTFAVPLGLAIVWSYAFILTVSGAYDFKGCNANVPISNIINEECRRHALTMLNCRTDMSSALRTAPWLRFPYPFQWGVPTFQWKSISVMMVASVIGCIDSVGSYHASSLLVATRPPTAGVVSRAIGTEGLASIFAGFWGIGTGVTTLTENVHAIAVTKIGSRRAVEYGACVLIIASVFGKISAFIASIPQVLVAALLSVMWIMITALGLSNFRYSETGSSRNVIIVGSSIFLSLSVPAYFQQYGTRPATVASYFEPYTVASHGPIQTNFQGLDFFLNTMFSMNMAVAFLISFFLDNTVPGGEEEKGTYIWSKAAVIRNDSMAIKDYILPPKFRKLFSWARWVGL